MARVTIQDCLEQIPSRFDLTMVAAKRARQLTRGAEARLPWDGHKSTVLALREIAQGMVTADVLKEADLPVIKVPATEFDPLDASFDLS
jgi:DNA-directed RNA polymerase subunit omega